MCFFKKILASQIFYATLSFENIVLELTGELQVWQWKSGSLRHGPQ